MTIYTDDEVRKGIAMLGLYGEARFLRQKLVEAIQYVPAGNVSDGALRENLGRRTFASELLQLMQYVPEAKRQDDDDRTDATELATRPGSKPAAFVERSLRRVPVDPGRGRR